MIFMILILAAFVAWYILTTIIFAGWNLVCILNTFRFNTVGRCISTGWRWTKRGLVRRLWIAAKAFLFDFKIDLGVGCFHGFWTLFMMSLFLLIKATFITLSFSLPLYLSLTIFLSLSLTISRSISLSLSSHRFLVVHPSP